MTEEQNDLLDLNARILCRLFYVHIILFNLVEDKKDRNNGWLI